MTRHPARAAYALATVLALGLTAACGSGADDGKEAGAAGKLALGTFFGAQTNFNPWLSPTGDNPTLQVHQMVYDSLTQVDPDGKVTPALATSWEFTDPTTLVVKLRDGVKFDDGTPLDANAVKANFDYASKAVPAGPYAKYFAQITTTVVDETTVELKSKAPQPDLPTDFAIGGGFIVNPKALKAPSGLKGKPDGTGPYTLAHSVQGQRYDFTRRKDYWDAKQYPYQSVQLKNFSSPQALENAMKAGQLQGGQAATPKTLPALHSAGLTVHRSAPTTLGGIWLSDRAGKIVPALGKVKVRQALNHAIDRAAIHKAATPGVGAPGSLIVPKGLPGYSAETDAKYTYDPAKAKKLLVEAGYPDGFTLPVLAGGDNDVASQAVAGYLRKIGVEVKLEGHANDYVNQLYSGKWAAAASAMAMVPTVQSLTALLAPDGSGNFNHSVDPEIQALLTKAQTASAAEQADAVEELVKKVNDEAWFLITAHNQNVYLTGKDVTCDIGQRSVCPMYTFRPAEQ
ncbi:ABC transporter substrate-binding protein [Streptomyces coelicoflavus]|uniref:ABC transporter substrate-binding protein n=1 Tax=Streptomyces coelicoflavus TaxID=285562 RepID=UPI00332FA554